MDEPSAELTEDEWPEIEPREVRRAFVDMSPDEVRDYRTRQGELPPLHRTLINAYHNKRSIT